MAELVVQFITLDGVDPAPLVPAGAAGDTFDNDGFTHLEIANANVAARTLTITGQRQLPAGTSATKTVNIPATSTIKVGPFPKEFYNTDLQSEVAVSYSTEVDLTVGAFSVKDANN